MPNIGEKIRSWMTRPYSPEELRYMTNDLESFISGEGLERLNFADLIPAAGLLGRGAKVSFFAAKRGLSRVAQLKQISNLFERMTKAPSPSGSAVRFGKKYEGNKAVAELLREGYEEAATFAKNKALDIDSRMVQGLKAQLFREALERLTKKFPMSYWPKPTPRAADLGKMGKRAKATINKALQQGEVGGVFGRLTESLFGED